MANLPGVNVSLQSVSETLNPQTLSSIFMVTGISSAGPLDTPTRLNSAADAVPFGNGPGIEEAVEIGNTAGWPVYFTRSLTTNPSVLSAVSKTPATMSGTPMEIFGAIVLPGSGHLGAVQFQSLKPGVSLTVVQGGMLGYSVAANGLDITLTVVAATTTGANIVGLALGPAAGLIGQPTNAGDSDGSALCDAAVAKQSFDDGSITYTALCAGAYLVPGADGDGGIVYSSKMAGISVQHVVAGLLTPPSAFQTGNTLVVSLATDGAGAVTGKASDLAAAVNASAAAKALGVTAMSTGAGTSHPAAIGVTLLAPPQIAHLVSGTNTTLSVGMIGSTIDVTDSTGAHQAPTGTATAILAAIPASLAAVISAVKAGSGSGLVGPKAATVLAFGSAGSLSLSGTPTDGFNLLIQVVRGGSPGSSPPLTIRWAVDYLAGTSLTPNWSSETLVPAGGIVALKNGALDTGITATFSGAFDALDLFAAFSTVPTSGATDILNAIQAAINGYDTVGPWGAVTGPDPVSKSIATLIDAKLQAAFGTTFIQGWFGTRGYNLAANETDGQWQTSIITDYQGFVSAHGLESISAGEFLHASTYTGFQFRRPLVIATAARKASIPMHQGLGRVKSGPIKNCLFIFHNEGQQTGLWTQRFITTRTYPRKPGAYYFTSSPTMADASDVGYTTTQWVATACDLARTLYNQAQNLIEDDLEFQANADPATNSVAGALTLLAASSIEGPLNKLANDLLFTAKTDGKKSASPLPTGQKVVNVSRLNDYAQDRTVSITAGFYPLGETQFVNIAVEVIIP